jgi:hypothetical protein
MVEVDLLGHGCGLYAGARPYAVLRKQHEGQAWP